MSKFIYLQGIAKWPKLTTPDNYQGDQHWKISLIPTKESQQLLNDSGLTLRARDTEEGPLYNFRRPVTKEIKGEAVEFGPPVVKYNDQPFTGMIGNGSTVTVKLLVYESRNGPGHRLEAVRVDDLVEYEQKELEEEAPQGVFPF